MDPISLYFASKRKKILSETGWPYVQAAETGGQYIGQKVRAAEADSELERLDNDNELERLDREIVKRALEAGNRAGMAWQRAGICDSMKNVDFVWGVDQGKNILRLKTKLLRFFPNTFSNYLKDMNAWMLLF
jgi:hypothetical protein